MGEFTKQLFGIISAFVILIAGYVMIWGIFKKLDAVAGQLGDIASKATGGLNKRLGDFRKKSFADRYSQGVEGKRNFGFFGDKFTGLGRRAQLSSEAGLGAFGIGRTGRAKYAEARRTMEARSTAAIMDQDKDRAGGDDDAMHLLSQGGMNEGKFLEQYSDLKMKQNPGMARSEAMQLARNSLGLTQSSFGARVGSNALRVAAQKSVLKSNTSYRKNAAGEEMSFHEMSNEVYSDVGRLVKDGLITVADGAAMIKSNGARADRAGVGFGKAISMLDQVSRGTSLSTAQTADMANDVLQGTGPGQIVGQRHEAIRILGPEIARRAREAYAQDGNQPGENFIQQIAAAAGRRDMAGQLPELNAGLNASGVEAEKVGGVSIQQWEEHFRTQASPQQQAIFQRYRREYSNAWQAGRPGPGDTPGALPHI